MEIKYSAGVGTSVCVGSEDDENSSFEGFIVSADLLVTDLQSMKVREFLRVLKPGECFNLVEVNTEQLQGNRNTLELGWLLKDPDNITELKVSLKTPYSCDIEANLKDGSTLCATNIHLGSAQAKKQIRFRGLKGAIVQDTATASTFVVDRVAVVRSDDGELGYRALGCNESNDSLEAKIENLVIRKLGDDCVVAIPELVDASQGRVISFDDGSVFVHYNIRGTEDCDSVRTYFSEIGETIEDYEIPTELE